MTYLTMKSNQTLFDEEDLIKKSKDETLQLLKGSCVFFNPHYLENCIVKSTKVSTKSAIGIFGKKVKEMKDYFLYELEWPIEKLRETLWIIVSENIYLTKEAVLNVAKQIENGYYNEQLNNIKEKIAIRDATEEWGDFFV